DVADGRMIKHWTNLPASGDLNCLGTQCRREIDQVIGGNRLARIRRGLRRKWLCRRIPFGRGISFGHGTFVNRPYRLSRYTIEYIKEGFLTRKGHGFDRFAINNDIRKNRRGRKVIVPNRMMNDLKMPFALACL